MTRTIVLLAAVASLVATECSLNDPSVDCSAELAAARITAHAGLPQSDGSVTVYGTIQLAGTDASPSDAAAELTVRAVYVGGQAVTQSTDGFNYRSWTATLTADRLASYASDGGPAHVPVVAYLYGGCVDRLPASDEPVVTVTMGTADGGAHDASDAAIAPETGQ